MNFLEKPVKNMITTKEKKIVRVAALFQAERASEIGSNWFPNQENVLHLLKRVH